VLLLYVSVLIRHREYTYYHLLQLGLLIESEKDVVCFLFALVKVEHLGDCDYKERDDQDPPEAGTHSHDTTYECLCL
jgi:hypothetical protein